MISHGTFREAEPDLERTIMADVTFPTVVIFNDPSSGEEDANVEKIAAAMQRQIDGDFGPAWHTGAHVEFVPSSASAAQRGVGGCGADDSDQAGALGYHDLTPDGLPLGKVFAGTDRQYKQKVSVTSRTRCSRCSAIRGSTSAAQSDDGKFYGWEACDAVEADDARLRDRRDASSRTS